MSGALPGGMNAEAYGSSDDGMETTPIFVTTMTRGLPFSARLPGDCLGEAVL